MASTRGFVASSTILAFIVALMMAVLGPIGAPGQTKIKPGMNFFSINDDIKLGRQASMQVEQQMPMVNDPVVQQWADQFGRHLASYTTMPNLPWQFRVTNSAQVNAFALPGGFVYINRGLIERTDRESELAGVIGHEMAHVTLRHGTNQLSKALLAQAPLTVLGGMGGGGWAMSQMGGVGLSMAFLKFSRTDETQADIVGTQTMVKAGYDPQGIVRIFQKLDQLTASSGATRSEFLSDHPNPGNRIRRIQQEIGYLQAPANPADSSPLYFEAKAHLRDMPFVGGSTPRPAGYGRRDPSTSRSGPPTAPGEPPSDRFETYRSSDGAFTVDYPSNWQSFSNGDRSVTIAPEWAMEGSETSRGAIVSYFDPRGPSSADGSAGPDMDQALNTIIQQLKQTNGYLREERGARYSGRLAGEQALATFLVGRTNQGVQERDWLIVRPGPQGIIYMLFVAPYAEFKQLQPTYQQMIRSFQMTGRGDRQ
jgi:Zn-dependent protease with chaperone function